MLRPRSPRMLSGGGAHKARWSTSHGASRFFFDRFRDSALGVFAPLSCVRLNRAPMNMYRSREGCRLGAQSRPHALRHQGITDVAVVAVAKTCGELGTLSLRRCGITDASLCALAQGCRKLRHIDLHQCEGISDIGVQAVVRSCTGLLHLDLGSCQGVMLDATADAIADHCRSLQHLELDLCYWITDRGVQRVAKACVGKVAGGSLCGSHTTARDQRARSIGAKARSTVFLQMWGLGLPVMS